MKRNILFTSLMLLTLGLSSCNQNNNNSFIDNSTHNELPNAIPECDFVGHGVDFSNGVINYTLESNLYTTYNTFEALIKIPETAKGKLGSIFSNQNSTSDFYLAFEVMEDGFLRATWNGGEGNYIFKSYNLKNGKWTFISFVRDKENEKIHFYINGVLLETIDAILSEPIIRERHIIGSDRRRWGSSKMPFKGQIKYLNGYRSARNASQIYQDFLDMNEISYINRGTDLLFSYDLIPNKYVIEDKSMFNNDALLSTNDYYYEQELWATKDYTFGVIGDPQMVVSYHNHYGNEVGALDTTIDYLLDNYINQKIDMTICVGDLSNMQTSSTVSHNNYEWNYVGKTFAKLDNIVNYVVTPGNHDYDGICQSGTDHTATYMNAEGRFPVSKFKNFSYWGGAYDENLIQNTYYYLETGGVNYLFLMLDYYPTDDVLVWADGVIKAHPNHRVVIATHSYLSALGNIVDVETSGEFANDGMDIYNKIIYPNDNVFMVFSGHETSDDILMHQSVTKGGNVVMEFIVDFQGLLINDGLDALLGLFTFDELNQDLYIDYYSTYHQKSFNIQNHYKVNFKGFTHLLSSTYYNEDGSLKGGN